MHSEAYRKSIAVKRGSHNPPPFSQLSHPPLLHSLSSAVSLSPLMYVSNLVLFFCPSTLPSAHPLYFTSHPCLSPFTSTGKWHPSSFIIFYFSLLSTQNKTRQLKSMTIFCCHRRVVDGWMWETLSFAEPFLHIQRVLHTFFPFTFTQQMLMRRIQVFQIFLGYIYLA